MLLLSGYVVNNDFAALAFFSNKVILDLNMLCAGMKDWIVY